MINAFDYQKVVLESMAEESNQPTYNRKLRKCLEKTTSQTIKEIERNTHTDLSAIKLRERLRKKFEERKKLNEEIEELNKQWKKEKGKQEIRDWFSKN